MYVSKTNPTKENTISSIGTYLGCFFFIIAQINVCSHPLAITLCTHFTLKLPVSLQAARLDRTDWTHYIIVIRLWMRCLDHIHCCWRFFSHLWRVCCSIYIFPLFKRLMITPIKLTNRFVLHTHIHYDFYFFFLLMSSWEFKCETTYHNVNIQFCKVIATNRLFCFMMLGREREKYSNGF